MRSRKAVFQRRPQNSPRLTDASGACISGRAFTPRLRQKQESRWNVPKWSTRIVPTMPTQPTRYGYSAGTSLAAP